MEARGFLKGIFTGGAMGALLVSWFSSQKNKGLVSEIENDLSKSMEKQAMMAQKAVGNVGRSVKKMLKK